MSALALAAVLLVASPVGDAAASPAEGVLHGRVVASDDPGRREFVVMLQPLEPAALGHTALVRDGRFAFAPLEVSPDAHYRLLLYETRRDDAGARLLAARAWAPSDDGAFEPLSFEVGALRPDAPWLTLRLLRPDGEPLRGALTIVPLVPGCEALHVMLGADDDGVLRLGTAQTFAWRDGAAHGVSDGLRIELQTTHERPLVLGPLPVTGSHDLGTDTLAELCTLTVVLRDASGEPLHEALGRVAFFGPQVTGDERAQPLAWVPLGGPCGPITMCDLLPGDWGVEVDLGRDGQAFGVAHLDGDGELTLTPRRHSWRDGRKGKPHATVALTLVGADGEPASGCAELVALGSLGSSRTACFDEHGESLLTDVATGVYRIQASDIVWFRDMEFPGRPRRLVDDGALWMFEAGGVYDLQLVTRDHP